MMAQRATCENTNRNIQTIPRKVLQAIFLEMNILMIQED